MKPLGPVLLLVAAGEPQPAIWTPDPGLLLTLTSAQYKTRTLLHEV